MEYLIIVMVLATAGISIWCLLKPANLNILPVATLLLSILYGLISYRYPH